MRKFTKTARKMYRRTSRNMRLTARNMRLTARNLRRNMSPYVKQWNAQKEKLKPYGKKAIQFWDKNETCILLVLGASIGTAGYMKHVTQKETKTTKTTKATKDKPKDYDTQTLKVYKYRGGNKKLTITEGESGFKAYYNNSKNTIAFDCTCSSMFMTLNGSHGYGKGTAYYPSGNKKGEGKMVVFFGSEYDHGARVRGDYDYVEFEDSPYANLIALSDGNTKFRVLDDVMLFGELSGNEVKSGYKITKSTPDADFDTFTYINKGIIRQYQSSAIPDVLQMDHPNTVYKTDNSVCIGVMNGSELIHGLKLTRKGLDVVQCKRLPSSTGDKGDQVC